MTTEIIRRNMGRRLMEVVLLLCLVFAPRSLGFEVNELRRTLVEEVPVGTVVADIPGELDLTREELLKSFEYSEVGDRDTHELFDVEKTTGMLRTAARVDRDVICPREYECTVEVRVGMKSGNDFHIISVLINILDLNDNSPTFESSYIHRKISETTAPGSLFPIQEAVDNDHPWNSTSRYELLPSSGQFDLQVTNNTETSGTVDLNLMLTENVDREKAFFYQMKIVAYDGGNPSKTGEVKIDIEIDDINDNSPRFENQTYTLHVHEDFSINDVLVTISATDADVGQNGLVTYRLSDKTRRRFGTMFKLDAESGALSLEKALDYEKETQYILSVLADDAGPGGIPGSAMVIVNVVDSNDNAPNINVETADGLDEITIEENSKAGSFVALLSAEDLDSGNNGHVECEVDNSNFRIVHLIDSDYKILTSRVMDREDQESHLLLIECHDLGNPMQSSSRNITIRVGDINDHVPVFEHKQYNISMYENNLRNALVVTVKAVDQDASKEGTVIYMLSEQIQEQFHVDPDSGEVRALVRFNREDVDHIEFEVIAIDGGDDKSRQSRCLVVLNILDADDNPPVFEQASYVFSIAENLPPRTEVGEVKADDQDLFPNNQFSYYLDLHNSASLDFRVDPNTGVIYTKRMLNRERISVYNVDVLAQDSSMPPVSDKCSVSIYVTDKNDNAPVIDFPSPGNSTVTMSLNAEEGSVIATVRAHDTDLGTNAVLYYMISEGNEGGEFIIKQQSGQVILNMPGVQLRKTAYELIIMVRDSGSPPQIAVSTLTVILRETSPLPIPGTPTDSPTSGRSRKEDPVGGISQTTLTIIICVIAGFLIVSLILAIAIVFVKRRPKRRRSSHTPMTGDNLWAQSDPGLEGPQEIKKEEEVLEREDSKMTEISDIILSLDSEPMNYQNRVEQLEKHSPKSDVDGDSGCADLSNSGSSQTSNEDSESSKRSSKASDAEAGTELHVAMGMPAVGRPHMLPVHPLVPGVPPMPLIQRRCSDKIHDPNNPDYGSLQRQRDRYPYEDDSSLRRTYSTPPKSQKVPPGALATARNQKSTSTLPRSLSNCSKKSVRFCEENIERPDTPKRHVHFADHDDVMSNSPERCKSPLNTVSEQLTEQSDIPMSSYPQDGTYTTFVPLKATSLSSLV